MSELRMQIKERGGLLFALACGSALVAAICVSVGLIVGWRAAVHDAVPIQQPAALLAVGMLLGVCTQSLWRREKWGSLLSTCLTVALAWITGAALMSRYGLGEEAKLPAVMFAGMALAYFSGPEGRKVIWKPLKAAKDEELE